MKFVLNRDKLTIEELNDINSGSVNYYKADVEHDESWNTLSIEAVLVKVEDGELLTESAVSIAVINNEMYIDRQMSGLYVIGFKGFTIVDEVKNYQISTNLERIWLDKGAGEIKTSNSESIPTEWETYLAQVQEFINNANEILDNAETITGQMEEALEDVNTAITETNNLDLDVNKVNKTTTVSLTKKDGTTKTVQIADGLSLEFMWQGTSLGIRVEGQEDYTFVDLQGIQGPVGPQGEAFQIKKTYSSVAEMNADFNNMQLGDYVMIASTVEVEDNAKLYTRGESQWIFISDFSGAQGIRGPVGATPNITIGTVTSGDTPNVTRSGTDENPVLNFTLVKGDKGDTGDTGATGNGISNIELVAETSSEKTFRINMTDGTYFDFTLENGEVTQAQLDEVIELNERLLNNTPKGSINTNPATMNDSADLPLNKFVLGGKTEQFSTTGKNLAGVTSVTGAITKQGDILILASGSTGSNFINLDEKTLEANTEYIIELFLEGTTTNSASSEIIIKDTNNNSLIDIYRTFNTNISYSFTPTTSTTLYRINLYNSSSSPTTGAVNFKLQIRKANTNEGYEPYTGGIPAPNPNYKEEIKNVEGINKFNIKDTPETIYPANLNYSIDNDKLIMEANITTGSQLVRYEYKELDNNKKYTIAYKAKKISGTDRLRCAVRGGENDTYTNLYNIDQNSPTLNTEYSFAQVITGYSEYQFAFYNSASNPVTLGEKTEYYEIMLLEGEYTLQTIPPYVPYNCIQIKKCNRNYWDNEKVTTEGIVEKLDTGFKITKSSSSRFGPTFPIKIPAGEWKMVWNKVTNATTNSNGFQIFYEDGTSTTKGYDYLSLTFTKNVVGIRPFIGYQELDGTYYEFTKIMFIPYSETATVDDYIPHAEKTHNFPLSEGQKLMEDGTIENKVINTYREGTITTVLNVGTASSGINYANCGEILTAKNNGKVYCANYEYNSDATKNNAIRLAGRSLYIYDNTFTSLEVATEALTGLKFQYELTTPDETAFTPEQQAVIDEIIKDGTYKEVTHYTAEALINPDMEIGYYKDLEIWVNNLINS